MRTELIQLGGWAILIAYLAQTPIAFDPLWVGVYVAVGIGVGFVYVLAIKPLVHLVSGTTTDGAGISNELFLVNPKNAPVAEAMSRRPLRIILLAPGETGLIFVPVAIIGVTWWLAFLAALLFGLAHCRTYSLEQCTVKVFTAFIQCYFILPHGVIHLAIGHLLVDAAAVGGFWLLTSKEERLSANSTVESDARESGARGSP